MPVTLDELESTALQLEPSVRAELIRRLSRTLESEQDQLTREEWIEEWGAEAERRLQELEAGKVQALDADEAMRRWRKRYS